MTTITRCAWQEVTEDVWTALDAVDFANHGNLPVAGGILDQTQSFTDVLKLARYLTKQCELRYKTDG